jgi:hypothetical protein
MLEPRPRSAVALLVVCGALALPACGRKTAVRPPEYAAPETITSLKAGNGADGIVLTWPRPARYADATRMTDLGAFRVERISSGAPFTPIATLEVTDRDRIQQERRFRWVDTDTVTGETYQYRVFSITTDGYVSAPSNIVTLQRAVPTPAPRRTATPR